MNKEILQKAEKWLNNDYDQQTREAVKQLINNNEKELIDSFYKNLEFGTGGLRGIMGAGTNRINKYTIGAATQGLCNYINKVYSDKEIKVAVAYDCRNNSTYFAQISADIFTANGFQVYLFESLRPTPELSFAVREFKCQAGIIITASHNPKEYNGYKVYWNDGAQITPPHDKNIITEVNAVSDITQINFEGIPKNITVLGENFDRKYIKRLTELSLSPEIIKKHSDFKIVYTPIHGTGVKLVPEALKSFGFTNIYNVPEQDITDGNFPTVLSPNPENAEALKLALAKAEEVNADLVLATDPDGDRVGIAVRNLNNELILLNGNQTASLLIYYLIKKRVDKNMLKGNEYIVKTIVTTELLGNIASSFGVSCYDTLTGFKYIAEVIRKKEGKELFIGGGEESYGYLAGEFVRDKDAVMSSSLIAETAVWAKEQGKSMYELLIDIYAEFGFYKEKLINIVKKGKSGAEEIGTIMKNFRDNPPEKIAGFKVIEIKDYLLQQSENFITESVEPLNFPVSNVIQFFTDDGSKITVRPSGTEPKIKFYISVNENLCCKDKFEETDKKLSEKIRRIKNSLNL
ncbi:MAG: phospho-sugar mutase [Bacteroidales bacterium]|nr:phospho-sugar mutase [Bacteroidales bacterium]